MRLEEIFKGRVNRFKDYQGNMIQSCSALKNLWIALKNQNLTDNIPRDLNWLPIEMKAGDNFK